MNRTGSVASAALIALTLATPSLAGDNIELWVRAGGPAELTYKSIIEGFTAKTGVTVDLFVANIDFETRLARAAAGGTLPDLIINDATSMGQLREMGVISQIDRDTLEGNEDIYDVAWKSVEAPDGNYYGVPTSAQAFAVFIRTKWLDNLGYEAPTTWEELYTLAKAFTEDDPDGNGKDDTYGYVMPLSNTRGYATWFMSDLIWQAGGQFLTQNGDGYYASLATPEVETAMEFARKMICEGYAQPSAITSTTGDATPVFSSGQAGIYRSGPYHLSAFTREPGREEIEVIAPPAGPAGEAELAEGEAAFITVTSEHPEAAKQFIEYLVSPVGQETGMAAGGEGGADPVVRLSINKKVDVTTVQPDAAWGKFAELYARSGHYFPNVPNWTPIRQTAADHFNKILSSCDSDIMAGLEQADAALDAELSAQGVLVK